MKSIARLALVAITLAATIAVAQSTVRVRGTITAIDGNVMAVKSRDGRDLKLTLPDTVAVTVAKAVKFEDIKQGDYVGTTTKPGPDGTHVAIEVHYLPPTVEAGRLAWDLVPDSTMTNANVASTVTATGKRELMLTYKGETQKVIVPEGVPLVRAVPGARSDLAPGEYIFTVVQVAADGTMNAPRVQVSKDGVKPPQ